MELRINLNEFCSHVHLLGDNSSIRTKICGLKTKI